jgi:hypothetical protein
MNADETQKMIAAFLKSGLTAKQAGELLAEAEKAEAARKKQMEFDLFLSGLSFRNFLAFIIFVIMFLFVAGQMP